MAGRLATAAGRFEGIDQALAKVVAELSDALGGYQRQVIEFHTGMDKGLASSLNSLNGMVTSLDDTLQDLTDALGKAPPMPGGGKSPVRVG